MKTALRIARLELSILFFSPIAWLVLIIFLFQTGLTFLDLLKGFESSQFRGYTMSNLTNAIFVNTTDPVFGTVQKYLFLYIPLLTMGLISREVSSGSIKLLLSSPVTTTAIVLGKFMAMMIYGLIMILILVALCIGASFAIQSIDTGMILSALTGLYLLICAYAAIGIFMSSLTSYPVVAAIATFVVFAALQFVGTVGQHMDFVRDITYFLSIAGRTDNMIEGLINSRDVIYFLLIISLFLLFTILRLRGAREAKPVAVKTGRYVLILILVLAVGYVTNLPVLTAYYDATATKQNTLTKNTQEIIKEIKSPLTINTFTNFASGYYYYGLPSMRNKDNTFFDKYRRFMPDMTINYFYYYDTTKDKSLYYLKPGGTTEEIARLSAEGNDFEFDELLNPQKMRKIINLEPEENRFVRQFSAGNKTSFVRIFNDMFQVPFEKEIATGLKRLITPVPTIAFITNNNARSPLKSGDKDYRMAAYELPSRSSLMNTGFEVTTISLDTDNIPAGIAALVIADPTTSMSENTIAKIRNYISGGGNLLIAGEPGRQSILNPVISPLGVAFMDGKLYGDTEEFAPDLIPAIFASGDSVLFTGSEKQFPEKSVVTMPGVSGIKYNDSRLFAIHPLLVTNSQNTWNRLAPLTADTGKVAFEERMGDDKRSIPVALALTRTVNNREQRIVVVGDADFMSNVELQRGNYYSQNFRFFEKLFAWFSYGEFPVNVDRPEPPDNKITLSKAAIGRLRIIYLGILPGLMAITAVILLTRRMGR